MTTPEQCAFAEELLQEWKIAPSLGVGLSKAFAFYNFSQGGGDHVQIISGHRSCEEQMQLRREGRPAADCDRSNHTVCPARAADVRLSGLVTKSKKIQWGEAVVNAGLRWGYGPPGEDGLPEGWNHVDLGPRT